MRYIVGLGLAAYTRRCLAISFVVDDPLFQSLVIRFRNGDVDAANKLVRHYEPAVRRVVLLRLANRPLHAIVDSMDICQSVMASFFDRFRLGSIAVWRAH
jgi:hypothetical protein